MIRARALVEDVGRFLADYDAAGAEQDQFITWSRLDLLSYFRLAVQRVLAADPKSFTKQFPVAVPGDGVVAIPPDCEECIGVIKHTAPTGVVQVKPNFIQTAPFVVARPTCGGNSARVTVMRDAQDRRTLFVSPASGTLTLSCTHMPQIGGDDAVVDIPSKYEPIIFDLMVAMAFGTEVESTPMRTRSDEHLKRALDALAVTAPPMMTKKK